MPIRESSLPGVGKKFEISFDRNEMVIVIHNTGKREIFERSDPETDADKIFEFDDHMARKIGSIIEGAHFQPVEAEMTETTLPGGLLLEWYGIAPGSTLIGQTLESADIGKRTGATIIAIQREEETITSPPANTAFEEGDTLIVIGTRENCEALEEVLAEA